MKYTKISTLVLSSILAVGQVAYAAQEIKQERSYKILYGHALPQGATQAAEKVLSNGAKGFSVATGTRDGNDTLVTFGDIDRDTQFPIASATKFLTAATVMAVVDEGKLSLDAPISTWLPEVNKESGKITLRQLLSQTSGLAGSKGEFYDLAQDDKITLRQSALEVTARPLISKPGSVFAYGGPGFQVAGALVEAVTGQRWVDVFNEKIGKPLGMDHTYWIHLRLDSAKELPPAETRNPILQGGAVSTVEDYMHFLSMLAQAGQYKGQKILSEKSIKEIFSDQTAKAFMTPTGLNALVDAHYSLGNWCETWDEKGICNRSSSLGAFGTYPWVEHKTGKYGIVFIYQKDNSFQFWPEIESIRNSISAQ